jgi:hypothetical protein
MGRDLGIQNDSPQCCHEGFFALAHRHCAFPAPSPRRGGLGRGEAPL